MSLRFLLITSIVLLMISGATGWLVYGERELGPDEIAELAHKNVIETARLSSVSGGPKEWTDYADALVRAPDALKNYTEAKIWYEKAAAEGYAAAQVGIGHLYENGFGVPQNYHRAVEWYATATRLSRSPEAQFKMGEAYFRGRGVPQDYGAALPYYLRAADQGHPIAQYIVGSMYEAGWGVRQDAIAAWVWYRRALPRAVQVDRHEVGYDVAGAIQNLERRMNNSQLEAARRSLSAIGN